VVAETVAAAAETLAEEVEVLEAVAEDPPATLTTAQKTAAAVANVLLKLNVASLLKK